MSDWPAQSALAATISGNTAGAGAIVSSGTLTLAGGNNVTLSQAGNAVTISGPNVGGAQTGISGISASDTLYTSGTVKLTGVGGGVTISSNTGQRVDISVAAPVAQTAQTGISGISASDTLYTSGTVKLTGVGGGVTISSNTGQRVDISVAAPVAQTAQTGLSGVSASDTLYTSGTIKITGVGGGITVSSNTAQRIDLSVAAPVAQTVQTQNVHNLSLSTSAGGGTAGTMAEISSGTVTLYAGNNITLSQSATNKIVISGPNTAAQTAQTGISSIAASNTTYTSGQVEFTGSNAATVKSSANQRVVIDVPVQTAQTQSNIQGIAGSNTTYNTGTVEITGSNMVTVKSSANQRLVIDATQTVQTQNLVDVTINGNSTSAGAGYALVSSGTLTLAGGPNITLSQDGNHISISGGAGAGGGIAAAGSNSTFTSGTVEWAGENNITVHSSTAAAGVQKILISAPNTSAQQTGISSIAASNTTYTSGSVEFTGSNMITVKSSANQRVVIDATQSVQTQSLEPNVAVWQNMPFQQAGSIINITSGGSGFPFFFPEVMPGNMTLKSVVFQMSNVSTGTLQSFTGYFGIYTLVNSTSAALLGSASDSWILSTASSASWSGLRNWVFTSPGTQANISSLSGGAYVIGMGFSAGAAASMNQVIFGASNTSASAAGRIVPGTNQASTGNTQGAKGLYGQYTVSSAALPANIVPADVFNQPTQVAAMPVHPWIMIRS